MHRDIYLFRHSTFNGHMRELAHTPINASAARRSIYCSTDIVMVPSRKRENA